MAIHSAIEQLITWVKPRASPSDTRLMSGASKTRLDLSRILAATTLLAVAEGCASQPASSDQHPDKAPAVSKADIAAIISHAAALKISEPLPEISPMPPPELGPPPQEPIELPIGHYNDEKKLDPSLTPERYYQKLVETLTTPELLAEFFRQHWHYQTDDAPGINHPDPSRGVLSINADRWQTPLQSIKRGIIGDCEDQAFLAAAILQDQGKLAFPIKFEDHAVALWAEHDGQKWILRSQCTRGQYVGVGRALSDAYESWWNNFRKDSSTPNDPAPNSLELMTIEENKGATSLYPPWILKHKNLAAQIGQARKLLEQGKAKECLDILYRLPIRVQMHPLLRELDEVGKAMLNTAQKFSR